MQPAADNISCLAVALCGPDTIVYKYRQPAAWFFCDRHGQIRKKKSTSNDNIFAAFTKGSSTSDDICAVYTYCFSSSHGKAKQTVIEHLTSSQLRDFLLNREKDYDGQLQRFIAPRRGHNSTLVATWSPQ